MNEGSIRQKSLREIWFDKNAFSYNRRFSEADLREHCAGCAFRHVCRAGCKSMAFTLTGNTSFNPMCLRHLSEERPRQQSSMPNKASRD